MTHIAIMIGIFGIPLLVSEIAIIRAFIEASVDVTRIAIFGLMIGTRVPDFDVKNFGPIELVILRSFPLDLLIFTGKILFIFIVVRMVFGFTEVDDVFTIDFGVVDVTFINFIVEVVKSLALKFLDVLVGIDDIVFKINFVVNVVEFKIEAFEVETLSGANVTFVEVVLGVEVIVEVLIEVDV